MQRIFISHSSVDAAAAKEMKARLEGAGHRSVFLDVAPDGLAVGQPWEQQLYHAIQSCQALILLCSETSMKSHWCFAEAAYTRALGKTLIPVRIDGCAVHTFLTDTQMVDFVADGPDVAYERLFRGLIAAGLDPATIFSRDSTRAPYPGLHAFDVLDAAVFFGRTNAIGEARALLNRAHYFAQKRFVLILGASGSGKTSLLQAGIVPRVRRETERWIVLDPFRPRTEPARELAAVLHRAGLDPLGDHEDALAEAVLELRRRSPHPQAKVLLTIDAFEDLLGNKPDARFLTLLRRAVEHPDAPMVLLATMRSDFFGWLQTAPPLTGLQREDFSLGPLTPQEIVETVEGPAREADLFVESELVSALTADAATPHALPLLALALRELWERYGEKQRRLTLEDYRKGLGGIEQIVETIAEQAFKDANSASNGEKQLRHAFVTMVRRIDDKYVRKRVRRSALPASVQPLLRPFVQARLVVEDEEEGQPTLEIAHERLFTAWKRLKRWIASDREVMELHEDLEHVVRAWDANGRTKDELWRGARVLRMRQLKEDGALILEGLEPDFAEACFAAERKRWWKDIVRRTAVLLVVLSAVVWLVLYQNERVRRAEALNREYEEAQRIKDIRGQEAPPGTSVPPPVSPTR